MPVRANFEVVAISDVHRARVLISADLSCIDHLITPERAELVLRCLCGLDNDLCSSNWLH
jgi:hypothetical protein